MPDYKSTMRRKQVPQMVLLTRWIAVSLSASNLPSIYMHLSIFLPTIELPTPPPPNTKYQMPSLFETTGITPLLRHSRSKNGGGGVFRMFKLIPMLTSGCKMVTLLGRPNKGLLTDKATIVTLFGYRRGRISLAIQDNPYTPPVFLLELPILTATLYKEMDAGLVKIALESETKTHRKKLMEEYMWAVYCNGRKSGYSIRRKEACDDDRYVMQHLRGVSMGAGVLPSLSEREMVCDGELTYLRARFERVVGSKDSESLYMINPDGSGGPELSIFLVRVK